MAGLVGMGSFGMELAGEMLDSDSDPWTTSPKFEFMVENIVVSTTRGLTWPFFGLVLGYKTATGQPFVSINMKFKMKRIKQLKYE
jgi:hypothetical protein